MASPFSGKAGRLAGMWAANQATQGLGQQMMTLTDAEQRAGGYLTQGYGTARDVMGSGYADMIENLQAAYGAAPGHLTAGRDEGIASLTAGRDSAIGGITTGRDTGTSYLTGGRDAGINAITGGRDVAYNNLMGPGGAADITRSGFGQAVGNVNQYYGQASDALKGASGLYDPLISKANAGYGMLNNALGLGGAEGNAAARGAFQAGPGYEWQQSQATEAAQRAANKIGGLYGGNTTDAVTRLSSNLANQEYQNWVKNLQPYQQAALQATQGKAAQEDLLASNYGQQGTALANLNTGEAKALTDIYGKSGDIYTQAGLQQANLYGQTGKQLSDLWSTSGQQIADQYRGTAQDVAGLQAKTGAALSGLTVDEGQQYAKTAGDYASGLASLAGGYGGSMAGLITGTAGNIAQAQQAANNTITQAGTGALMAGQQASANSWGAALGLLGAGTKLLGGSAGGGFGSLIGSLFK